MAPETHHFHHHTNQSSLGRRPNMPLCNCPPPHQPSKCALIHAPDDHLLTAITYAKLQKLKNLYQPPHGITPFPQPVAQLIPRDKATNYEAIPAKEQNLYKRGKHHNQPEPNGTWPIPDTLFDTLHHCFNIKQVIHCIPVNLPLRAKEYSSHDPLDSTFGAMPYTRSA